MSRLETLRKNKGMTQEELGKLLNVQKAAISKYERGIIEPNQDTLIKLSKIFNCSIDYIVGLTDEMETTLNKQKDIEKAAYSESPLERDAREAAKRLHAKVKAMYPDDEEAQLKELKNALRAAEAYIDIRDD